MNQNFTIFIVEALLGNSKDEQAYPLLRGFYSVSQVRGRIKMEGQLFKT